MLVSPAVGTMKTSPLLDYDDSALISLIRPQPLLNQPPDRFGARRLRLGLSFNPGCELRIQLPRDAHPRHRSDARPWPAARSFLIISY